MNRRELITGLIATATISTVNASEYAKEEYIMQILKNMKIGDSINVIKVGSGTWRLTGDFPPRRK
jgi:hypothetical protein